MFERDKYQLIFQISEYKKVGSIYPLTAVDQK
jgi:hypothetical protein